ncbi:hypothetical protein EON81_02485 [bacterium]|nr:MAG: hypothetical protein EON81_02485 [bacterium]
MVVPLLAPVPVPELRARALRESREGRYELLQLALDGRSGAVKGKRRLTELPAPSQDRHYQFETDATGNQIAYLVGKSDHSSVRIFDLRTGRHRALPHSLGAFRCEWSPDGKRIAVVIHSPSPSSLLLDSENGAVLAQAPKVEATRFLRSSKRFVGLIKHEQIAGGWSEFVLLTAGKKPQPIDESATDALLGPAWRRSTVGDGPYSMGRFLGVNGSVSFSPSGHRAFRFQEITEGDYYVEDEFGPSTEGSYRPGIYHYSFFSGPYGTAELSGYLMTIDPLGWSRDGRFMYAVKSGSLTQIDAETGMSKPIRNDASSFRIFWIAETATRRR